MRAVAARRGVVDEQGQQIPIVLDDEQSQNVQLNGLGMGTGSNTEAASAHGVAHEKWRKLREDGEWSCSRVSGVKRATFQIWCFFISRHSVVRLTCSSRAVADTSP